MALWIKNLLGLAFVEQLIYGGSYMAAEGTATAQMFLRYLRNIILDQNKMASS